MCWRLDEDTGHCFLKCKIVKQCWRQLNLEEVRVNLLTLGSAMEVVQNILSLQCEKQKPVIIFLCAWWTGRNKANAGERGGSVDEIISRATFFTTEIYKLNRREEDGGRAANRDTIGWKPPPPNVLKINPDGAFREMEKMGAWGFVVQDSNGRGIIAGCGRLQVGHDTLSAEGEACLMALKAAMEIGISWVIIETDSVNLVTAVQTGSFDRAPGGVIFKEIQDLLELHFVPLHFIHVRHSCNRSAHDLAHSSCERDPDQPVIWHDPLPVFVRTMLGRDYALPEFGE